MTFSVSWHTLLDELDEGATLITPLSHDRFCVTDVQEQRVVIEFLDRDIDETPPLQRDQFETLYRRVTDEPDGFDLDRLPPDVDPYPAVLSVHPGSKSTKTGPSSSRLTGRPQANCSGTTTNPRSGPNPTSTCTRMRSCSSTRSNVTR